MEDTSQGSSELLPSSVGGVIAGKLCPRSKNSDLLHSSVGRELTGQVCFIQLEEHCMENDVRLK